MDANRSWLRIGTGRIPSIEHPLSIGLLVISVALQIPLAAQAKAKTNSTKPSESAKRQAVLNPVCGRLFEGNWSTNYGQMSFAVNDGAVSGSYEKPLGTFTGTVTGNRLNGQWVQADGTGTLSLTLAADRRTFIGAWTRKSGNGNPDGKWEGTCIQESGPAKGTASVNAKRKSDLREIYTALLKFEKSRGYLPTTSSFGEANYGGWDYSSQGDFLPFLKSTGYLPTVPRDPVNDGSGDVFYGGTGFSYAYFCYDTNTLSLGAKLDDGSIYWVANHEGGHPCKGFTATKQKEKPAQANDGSNSVRLNLSGNWIYYDGQGQSTITQTGSTVRILNTWTPSSNTPQGEIMAVLTGLKLMGTYRCLVSPDTGPCKDTAGKNFKFSATVDQDGNTIRVSDDSYELPGDSFHGLVWTRKPTLAQTKRTRLSGR